MQTEDERYFSLHSFLSYRGKISFLNFSYFSSLNIHHDAAGIKQKAKREKNDWNQSINDKAHRKAKKKLFDRSRVVVENFYE